MMNAHDTNRLTVAEIIRDQLGRRALMMLGADRLVGSPDSLAFRVKGSREVNHIEIKLDPSDTYTVTFRNVGRSPMFLVKDVAQVEFVYVDSLHAVIEKHTGLYTSLGTLGAAR